MFQKLISAFCFFTITATLASAQVTAGKNEFGINVGGLFYQGDLTPNLAGSYKTARPSGDIYYNRILSPYLSARLNVAIGSLAGDDSKYSEPAFMRLRNFNFHSSFTEVSALVMFNIFGNNGNAGVMRFSPYIFAGGGVSFLNIYRDWSRVDSSQLHAGSYISNGLKRDSATNTPRKLPVIPFGAGFRYAAFPSISIVAEFNYRVTFSDYIDGFSYAANPERNDRYYSFVVGAVYNFGKNAGRGSTGCPTAF